MAKVKVDSMALICAGYIGGAAVNEGNGVAVDAAGNAYVTGRAESDQTTFPVKEGPVQGRRHQAFLCRLSRRGRLGWRDRHCRRRRGQCLKLRSGPTVAGKLVWSDVVNPAR